MWPIPKTTLGLLMLITMLLAVVWVLSEQRAGLQDKVDTIRHQHELAKADISGLTDRLASMAEAAHATDLAQAQLRDDIARTQSLLATRTTTIERLKRENAALRIWADAALPADVVRLRDRPEFAGAAAYRDWLSARDSLPLAGEPADHQRPAIQ